MNISQDDLSKMDPFEQQRYFAEHNHRASWTGGRLDEYKLDKARIHRMLADNEADNRECRRLIAENRSRINTLHGAVTGLVITMFVLTVGWVIFG